MGEYSIVAKRGRVTGTIGPGRVGEVTMPFRGGTNTYLAYPFDGTSVIPIGHEVLVIEYKPPITVHVVDLDAVRSTLDVC